MLIVRFRMGSAKSEGTKPKLHNLADVRNVRTEAIVAALYNLEPSCRRRGGRAQQKALTRLPDLQDGGYCG